jgi:DNA-binding MarR family transcriptional regulator
MSPIVTSLGPNLSASWQFTESQLTQQHPADGPVAVAVASSVQYALAERLGIDASYVTSIADQLEERGLIARQPHPTDRRIKSLALTAEGRLLREKLAEELWVQVPVLDTLSASERSRLRELLERSVDAAR